MGPSVSVVIPVYNGAADLQRCLDAWTARIRPLSNASSWTMVPPIISAEVAARYGVRSFFPRTGRCGPAARNLGAKAARGEISCSSIPTSPCTAIRCGRSSRNSSGIPRWMPSWVVRPFPSAPNFMSQYRNLMHFFVHHHSNPEATTFWAGCGAVRRSVFLWILAALTKKYRSPAIEDIELGYRMAAAASEDWHLDPRYQVKHLKRWSCEHAEDRLFLSRRSRGPIWQSAPVRCRTT